MRDLIDVSGETPLDATLTERDARWLLTLERELPAAPDSVWPHLTRPELLVHWSPCVPDRPLVNVGPATARENPDDEPSDAEVLVAREPVELIHRWGDAILCWTLAPRGDDSSTLTLEQAFDDRDFGPDGAAGWHVCLDVLDARLRGRDVDRVVGQDAVAAGWARLREAYTGVLGDAL